jgi:hypothetical protein
MNACVRISCCLILAGAPALLKADDGKQGAAEKTNKYLVITNKSKKEWNVALDPLPAKAANPGKVMHWEYYEWDSRRDASQIYKAMDVGENYRIFEGGNYTLWPVPEKSIGTRLGRTKRPDFDRTLTLTRPGAKVRIQLFRVGGEPGDNKLPRVTILEGGKLATVTTQDDPDGLTTYLILNPQ